MEKETLLTTQISCFFIDETLCILLTYSYLIFIRCCVFPVFITQVLRDLVCVCLFEMTGRESKTTMLYTRQKLLIDGDGFLPYFLQKGNP